MSTNFSLRSGYSGYSSQNCLDQYGCPSTSPDFIIKRHDTKPPIKVLVSDCQGPIDLRGLVIEANMWSNAKLKRNITPSDLYFDLADNRGFDQIMVGDIIVMDRVRNPEKMLVVAFDEENKLVKVQRGYHGTQESSWKKGTILKIFRILNAPAEGMLSFEDETQVDGTTKKDVIISSHLVYEWQAADTCLPGCYWMEFKVLKMIDPVYYITGGQWLGETHKHIDGFFYTGSTHTSSSVKLSYNQIENKYLLSNVLWDGDIHLHVDNNYYSGEQNNDGSVLLNNTGMPSNSLDFLHFSIIPSFTDETFSPADFGCGLGEGVEWVRRFPMISEGFLIKIENSLTSET
jgi:hypothetical protein